jgi:release factor glutamine methyltransferase
VSEGKIWPVGEVLQWTTQYFADKGINNPRLDAEVLLAHVLKADRLRLYVDFHKPLQAAELTTYRRLIKQRAQRIPVAYLTGNKEFMGFSFFVSPAVLIPRPDTEILVETVLKYIDKEANTLIVDVGTGSGAIIISLLKMLPAAEGIAIDISPEALAIAKENACRQAVEERLEFVQGDLLQPVKTRRVDIIVANPPYIPARDIAGLEPEVQKEPLLALHGGSDGLVYYHKLIEQSIHMLVPKGRLAFEVGLGQAEQVAELMRNTSGYRHIEIVKDYGGIERVVIGTRE